ncbi:NfeD family protein [Thiobacillus sedimenti]|uniref:NfeD family protein n=1 Tax=Thiobacillus sedimenti TaxID=3110231 RepID=A0ABZ1CGQ6_9PROT|nr:NfeD family protein [Thiobacillus sp. SCUT-2]WRS38096.1 NfeD family protein [Thiobacillus sp. SCUT-2]
MQAYMGWWILAAVLVGIELTSGTFYLLVYGIAAAAAGVAAWFGAGTVAQLLTAAVIAVAGTLALRRWRRSTEHPEASVQDMDIGQAVRVESWQAGRGQVIYRGALWDAEAESAGVDGARPLVIRAVRGNTLILGNAFQQEEKN